MRISTQKEEGIIQVSKARLFQVLLDSDEIRSLFEVLKPFSLFCVGRPLSWKELEVSLHEFLSLYDAYIEGIKKGTCIEEKGLFRLFSTVMTVSESGCYAEQVGFSQVEPRYLIRAKVPLIQLQKSHFLFTSEFHLKIVGKESISWGIAFSYPQLYLDPHTQQIEKVIKSDRFPNTVLFEILAKWIRNHTLPTPFLIPQKEKKSSQLVRQPLRLGKSCFSWINNHPGLKMKNLYVDHSQAPSKTDFEG